MKNERYNVPCYKFSRKGIWGKDQCVYGSIVDPQTDSQNKVLVLQTANRNDTEVDQLRENITPSGFS